MYSPMLISPQTPHLAAGCRCALFNIVAQVNGTTALKPREAAADRNRRMGVAIAQFWEVVARAIGLHDSAVGVEAAETGIPGFNAINPGIARGANAIQGLWLAADAAKNAMEGVRNDSYAVLFVDQINTPFHAQAGWNK